MVTINEVCEAYLEDRRSPIGQRRCKNPRGLDYHLRAVRKRWGKLSVKEFAADAKPLVLAALTDWDTDGKAPATQRKRLSILMTAIRFGMDEGLVKRKHEPRFRLPADSPPRERCVDPADELPRLLVAAEQSKTPAHTLLAVELALRTGCRIGAILDLTWALVDFEKRVLWFKETEARADRTKKKRVNKPMDDALYELLQRAYRDRDEDCDHVVSWRGKRVKSVYGGMKALFKRAGVPDLRVHDLRRTSATYVHNESDGNDTMAAAHIGDTVEVARRHYIKEDPKVGLPAVEALSRVIDRARGSEPASDLKA